MSSLPPTTSAAPRERLLALESSRSWGRRRGGGDLRLSAYGATLTCDGSLQAPLRLPLGTLALGVVDRGTARPGSPCGRFAVLRRLSAHTFIPFEHGIEGWLWTSLGGTGLTLLGDPEDAPNAGLLFTKPLGEEAIAAFEPAAAADIAARSPLGAPAVLGLLFRVEDTGLAESTFKAFNLLRPLTDREVPPTLRRALPTDKPADELVARSEDARAATSVAPPGLR
jgi:hypothetical protein